MSACARVPGKPGRAAGAPAQPRHVRAADGEPGPEGQGGGRAGLHTGHSGEGFGDRGPTHVQLPASLLLLPPLLGHPLRPLGLRPPPVLLFLLLRQVFEVGSDVAGLGVGYGGEGRRDFPLPSDATSAQDGQSPVQVDRSRGHQAALNRPTREPAPSCRRPAPLPRTSLQRREPRALHLAYFIFHTSLCPNHTLQRENPIPQGVPPSTHLLLCGLTRGGCTHGCPREAGASRRHVCDSGLQAGLPDLNNFGMGVSPNTHTTSQVKKNSPRTCCGQENSGFKQNLMQKGRTHSCERDNVPVLFSTHGNTGDGVTECSV